ncbi:ATP-grasp domain-containing protein [Flexivirga meconopsidis]|uniref:ATP-grasp domain-containing protein n=1 Tax=Flexivirga meconopsidis TaxID=2977121 RepID=UPI00223F3A7B|nr:ATP-grasp domain-containing protein [Flexivirga meconopsidis]
MSAVLVNAIAGTVAADPRPRFVVLEPRSSGLRLLKHAARLGHPVVVVVGAEGYALLADQVVEDITEIVRVDTADIAATGRALRELHRRTPIGALFPGQEQAVQPAARLAVELGLRTPGPVVAQRLRHKHLMRDAVRNAGIDQPRYVAVTGSAAVRAALRVTGTPSVVKPVDQSGSLGVRKVETVSDARAAMAQIARLVEVDEDHPILVEEYVEGPEFSVEGVVADGTVHVVGVTEKRLGSEPTFVEIGHLVPAGIDDRCQQELREYARKVVHALGLRLGPFHLEVRMGVRGPMLMEVAARLPGDRIPDLWLRAAGADLYAATVASYLGEEVRLDVARPDQHVGIRYLDLDGSETSAPLAAQIGSAADVFEQGRLRHTGVGQVACSARRLAYAMAASAQREPVLAALDHAISEYATAADLAAAG